MIVSALAALALAAADPPPAVAPPATPAPAAAPAEDAIQTLADLRLFYTQTCDVKAYATYDDICHAARDQIHDAEKAADREAKQKAAAAKATQTAANPAR